MADSTEIDERPENHVYETHVDSKVNICVEVRTILWQAQHHQTKEVNKHKGAQLSEIG